MADTKDSSGDAEKAYAEAASGVKPAAKAPEAENPAPAEAPAPAPVVAPVEAPVTSEAPAPKAPVTKPVAKKPAAKKAAPKPKAASVAAKKKAPAKAKPVAAKKTTKARRIKPAAAKKAPVKPAPAKTAAPTVTELKEKIMATKTTDFTAMMSKSMNEAVAEMQTKAQEAYDKGTGMVSEMTEAAKGNVEAVVESGKIMAAGMQDLGKSYADEAKSAYETLTADMKEMAGVKSPTELFQLQGKIMRRNFDAMVASTSKGTEAAMKLANDVVAPISARVNVAVEKISKAA